MELSEVLEKLDILVPNSLPDRLKIMFMNDVQREIFRDFPFVIAEAFYDFNTEIDEAFYVLPSNCPEDRIISLTVDGKLVTQSSDDQEESASSFWSIVSGLLFLYPTPTGVVTATIFYRPQPADLTGVPTQKIELSGDYSSLLVYGAGKLVAMTLPTPDESKANFCEREFFRISEIVRRRRNKYLPKGVVKVRSWS